MGKNVHIVPSQSGGWAVKKAGNARASSVSPTKEHAVNTGRDLAKREHSELIVHGRNGRIQSKDSLGADHCPPKDREH